MPWLELLFVILFAIAGGAAGWRIGRIPRLWWLGFIVPLSVISLVIVGHRSPRLYFQWPFSWAVDVRVDPLLMAVAVPLMLMTLMVKMPRDGRRRAIGILTGAMLAYYSLLPGICVMIGRAQLAQDDTKFDRAGVCWQSRNYTCGPAAAVTCLHFLGLDAHEGAIGIEARCGPVVGTDERMLAAAIDAMFKSSGIHAQARWVGNLEDLHLPAVADTTIPGLVGHYVAVLGVNADFVLVGDPLAGLQKMPRAEFLNQWTGSAVEILRDQLLPGQEVAQQ